MVQSGSKDPENKAEIHELIGNNMFDANALLVKLEEYVSQQVTDGTYDFKANRQLLQLYNLAPMGSDNTQALEKKCQVVEKILLLSLAQLPLPHFLACTFLVQGGKEMESMRVLSHLHYTLESGSFASFWAEAAEAKTRGLLSKLPGIDDAMRRFICLAVMDSYQELPSSDLLAALNLKTEAELAPFVEFMGAKASGGSKTAAAAAAPAKKGSKKKGSKKKKSGKKGKPAAAPAPAAATTGGMIVLPLGRGNQLSAVQRANTERLTLDSIASVLERL